MNPYDYINSLSKFGTSGGFKPGLERIEYLLAGVGHPERDLPVIHVAGSNGKGSTIAFLKQIYQQAGYRTGAYISPHLVTFNERMEINGRYITDDELRIIIEILDPIAREAAERTSIGQPSYFEFVTAVALTFFKEQGVDILLLETGLGGRLDATNIISSPLLSIITGISLEHTDILGNNIEDIAREKAGIIKEGRPVISGIRNKEALKVIEEIAVKVNSPLRDIYQIYDYRLKAGSLEEQCFDLIDKKNPLKEGLVKEYHLGLPGEHQVRNALLALAAVEELKNSYPVTDNAIDRGLREAFIPGRLEIIQKEPLILLDGAHNPEGIEILVEFLRSITGKKTRVLMVIGILGDKDVKEMIRLLQSVNNLELIITRSKEKRALDPDIIRRIADNQGIKSSVFPEISQAINYGSGVVRQGDIICITGSLYTVAEAKIIFS
jgi:dihydrofolate synthase / folylpolyglutamate synthase